MRSVKTPAAPTAALKASRRDSHQRRSEPVVRRELNGNIAWGFPLAPARLSLYVGGGVNIARSGVRGVPDAAQTNLGINFLAGLRFLTGTRATPYVELRPELGGGNRLVISTGVMF